jgi:Cu(I)/Ag(I) efflux system protein CusF
MRRYIAVIAVVTLSTVSVPASRAQSGGMGGMDMKGMDMMGKDKKDKATTKSSPSALHKGTGTITSVNSAKSTVTIAHGPIQTMKWESMTMAFRVKDKTLLDKLSTGKKVEFEFVQESSDYMITSIK